MLQKLGFEQLDADLATALVNQTIDLLSAVQVGYHLYFLNLSPSRRTLWRLMVSLSL
ncbi:protein adenylyltransferase SelO family protein [Leptolyngbya sp. KIOST-1]|uniref:protein adenylyltransferase SelO family protein n=1 Tax=Leptolyngbya sp. KIOST-1 TaxID=1229172 RepID=UPI0009DF2405|nr:protein adenylyltransferase SelO family protein [Leptolyngbya sp. KIOST-1]